MIVGQEALRKNNWSEIFKREELVRILQSRIIGQEPAKKNNWSETFKRG